MSANQTFDVVVIGAGAAGIAAARALNRSGLRIMLVEARARAGGRAWTRDVDGLPLDIGCEWLHSADENALVPLARDEGVSVDDSPAPWQGQPDAQIFPPEEHAGFRAAMVDFDARVAAAAGGVGDGPASSLLPDGGRWNPLLGAVSAFVNGVELDRLSIRDVARYRDTEVNYRLSAGMGALIASLAGGLPIVFGCPVRRIDHAHATIRLATAAGDIMCQRLIVAVPTSTIAQGHIVFAPELPDHADAAAHLPLGVANKIFLEVADAGELAEVGFVFGHRDRTATGSFHSCRFDRPVIEGYFGGAFARELEAAGVQAFAEEAIAELCGIFGNRWRKLLRPIATSQWASDPFALGSYSHALPGHADKRAVLATPHEGRIFFAGEATAPHFFSTAHGAWESGLRAAGEALASLRQAA